MEFLNRNSGAIQAVSAMLTVVLALAAIIGVKVQIDAAQRIQQAQSARDIYREYLSHSVANPAFSDPNYCNIRNENKLGAYESYVGLMLYSAEQMLAIDPSWNSVVELEFLHHREALCAMSAGEMSTLDNGVLALLNTFRSEKCTHPMSCQP